jgi:tRNA U55 pseudouridine synthase TruB
VSVQTLVNEIGHRLGCGAHLTHWRREAVGGFSVDNAWTLDVVLPVARKLKAARRKQRD